MKVRELVQILQKLPQEAEVIYYCPPVAGQNFGEELDPHPRLDDDGIVKL